MRNDPSDTQPVRSQAETRPVAAGMEDTQPTPVLRPLAGSRPPAPPRPPAASSARSRRRRFFTWALLAIVLTGVFSLLGAFAGVRSGMAARSAWEAEQSNLSVKEQYELGLLDMQEGRYQVALQRFEYVIQHDPTFPGAADRLVEVNSILFATATPTSPPPTITPTPTVDPRPMEDLFNQALQQFAAGDWNALIDTLTALRGKDPQYQAARVDGMLYMALRNRGVRRILSESDLGGGSYDLSLAERFGPLDAEARNVLNLARLYLYGNAFWEAYPEQAVYYFSQVAAAAPGLRDSSGWTAAERYRAALLQWADQLARQEEWCKAEEVYNQVLSWGGGNNLQATADYAAEQCRPPTETATITPTITETPTETPTGTFLPPTTAPVTTAPPTITPTPPAPTTPAPPPTTEHPPATTEPPVVTTEPPPVETEPPPVETEPPADTEPAPVVTDEITEAPPQSGESTGTPEAAEIREQMNRQAAP